jgi:hypothetical protein
VIPQHADRVQRLINRLFDAFDTHQGTGQNIDFVQVRICLTCMIIVSCFRS